MQTRLSNIFKILLAFGLLSMSLSIRAQNIPDETFRPKTAPLGQLLDQIAQRFDLKIHSSLPSETLISANCSDQLIKPLMDCLFGTSTNLIYRYEKDRPSELWILASNIEPRKAQANAPKHLSIVISKSDPAHTPHQEIKNLLDLASHQDPNQRASALSRLSLAGHEDDMMVHQALEKALSDRDANVRAQAIFGIARREGSEAVAILQQALQDPDAAVRMMAIDAAGSDAFGISLLKSALTDNDQSISALATLKLKSLL